MSDQLTTALSLAILDSNVFNYIGKIQKSLQQCKTIVNECGILVGLCGLSCSIQSIYRHKLKEPTTLEMEQREIQMV